MLTDDMIVFSGGRTERIAPQNGAPTYQFREGFDRTVKFALLGYVEQAGGRQFAVYGERK